MILPLQDFEANMVNTRSEVLLTVADLALLSLLRGLAVAVYLTRRLTQAKKLAARVAGGGAASRSPPAFTTAN